MVAYNIIDAMLDGPATPSLCWFGGSCCLCWRVLVCHGRGPSRQDSYGTQTRQKLGLVDLDLRCHALQPANLGSMPGDAPRPRPAMRTFVASLTAEVWSCDIRHLLLPLARGHRIVNANLCVTVQDNLWMLVLPRSSCRRRVRSLPMVLLPWSSAIGFQLQGSAREVPQALACIYGTPMARSTEHCDKHSAAAKAPPPIPCGGTSRSKHGCSRRGSTTSDSSTLWLRIIQTNCKKLHTLAIRGLHAQVPRPQGVPQGSTVNLFRRCLQWGPKNR